MYYIRALIYDFLSWCLYVHSIGGVAKCVGDVKKVNACTHQTRVINKKKKQGGTDMR